MPDVNAPTINAKTALAPSPNGGRSSGNLLPFRRSLHTRDEWPLSDGPQGTFEALSLMRSAVLGQAPPDYSGYRDPAIKVIALEIAGETKPLSIDRALKVFFFVRDQIQYFNHKPEEQVVQDAIRTLEIGSGDCVSQSVLLATLLGSLGYKSYFVVQMPSCEEGYTHVYVDCIYEDRIIAMDPIADSKDGRALGSPGWSQSLPPMGFETSYPIFD